MQFLTSVVVPLLVALLGGGALGFVEFLIRRKDGINKRLKSIEKHCEENHLDAKRTQLLLLMANYPDDVASILKVAQHYFEELHGDWYMSSKFAAWMEQYNIPKPLWFKED